LILFTLARSALLKSPVGPPRLRSSPVFSFMSAPDARGESTSMTFAPWDEDANSAEDTPTGPAPMMARSYVLPDTSVGSTWADSAVVVAR
jgi:hypothetical protein